jgi:hypothetical protein
MCKRILLLIVAPGICIGGVYLALHSDSGAARYLGTRAEFTALLTVFLTYCYVVLTMNMVQHMVSTQEGERRPYIVADIEFEDQQAWLVLRNLGKMPAKDIRIVISPALIGYEHLDLSEKLFKRPIAFFPPGKASRSYIDESPRLLANGKPLKYEVNLSYEWAEQDHRRYQEKYTIDLEFDKNRATLSGTKKSV